MLTGRAGDGRSARSYLQHGSVLVSAANGQLATYISQRTETIEMANVSRRSRVSVHGITWLTLASQTFLKSMMAIVNGTQGERPYRSLIYLSNAWRLL
jgi:hypothetical protein